MNWTYSKYENFREFANKDRFSAQALCDTLNLNFLYFRDFDKQTGYVDEWAFNEIYVYPSIQDFALYYIHQAIVYVGIYPNGVHCTIPEVDKYINLETFGNALLDNMNTDCVQLLPNGKIVILDCRR